MRKIKFRAWDIPNNCFIPNDYYVICNDGKSLGMMIKDWNNYQYGEHMYSPNQILSQFTGLKDKNSIDIYESDIVEIWGGEQAQGFWEISIRGQFIFSYNAFVIKDKKDIHYDPSMFDATIQIIGNIYENPELL